MQIPCSTIYNNTSVDKFSSQFIIDQQIILCELRKHPSFLFLPQQNNVQIHSDHA